MQVTLGVIFYPNLIKTVKKQKPNFLEFLAQKDLLSEFLKTHIVHLFGPVDKFVANLVEIEREVLSPLMSTYRHTFYKTPF